MTATWHETGARLTRDERDLALEVLLRRGKLELNERREGGRDVGDLAGGHGWRWERMGDGERVMRGDGCVP